MVVDVVSADAFDVGQVGAFDDVAVVGDVFYGVV